MTAEEVIAALQLPPASLVGRRVSKALLLEHGAPTAADRRRINEGIEQLRWVAALKPTSIGVPVHRDSGREYLEVMVLRAALRPGAKAPRIIELLHRAVPYPLLAVTEIPGRVHLSLAHKRWSQSEAGTTVLDRELIAADVPPDGAPFQDLFAAALALEHQPRVSLLALYQGWIDTVLALEAARMTGRFTLLSTPEKRAARAEALRECARLDAEAARLRTGAVKEKQMARRVDFNLELSRIDAARAALLAML